MLEEQALLYHRDYLVSLVLNPTLYCYFGYTAFVAVSKPQTLNPFLSVFRSTRVEQATALESRTGALPWTAEEPPPAEARLAYGISWAFMWL